jgi:hypothetical protein
LLKCLHPFGNYPQMQAVGHADDRTDNGADIHTFREVANERPIELERVYRKALANTVVTTVSVTPPALIG